ncbi:phage tail protein [Hymenobacter sp. HMF4947]|uniref:Phage tail protein n=2 Tax=Hymenobacter ginkgonis TaxID=2682976 RepID=A0A7K1TBA3_9BACT|nr:phage tail protein [Hymenobacter ginkgonis]
MLVSFNFPPKGWAFCNGQLLPINQNQALFALLGTTYGGNGQTTFALPDLRGRVPMCFGQGAGLTNRDLGEKAGTETVALSTAQIAHTHSVQASTATGTTSVAGTTGPPSVRNYLADNGGGSAQYSNAANVTMADALSPVGGGQSHLNIQPVLGMNFVIALQGVFPSQN